MVDLGAEGVLASGAVAGFTVPVGGIGVAILVAWVGVSELTLVTADLREATADSRTNILDWNSVGMAVIQLGGMGSSTAERRIS